MGWHRPIEVFSFGEPSTPDCCHHQHYPNSPHSLGLQASRGPSSHHYQAHYQAQQSPSSGLRSHRRPENGCWRSLEERGSLAPRHYGRRRVSSRANPWLLPLLLPPPRSSRCSRRPTTASALHSAWSALVGIRAGAVTGTADAPRFSLGLISLHVLQPLRHPAPLPPRHDGVQGVPPRFHCARCCVVCGNGNGNGNRRVCGGVGFSWIPQCHLFA